jgi:PRTRC genetic system protein C
MVIQGVKRRFEFKNVELEDPNPKMTVQQVKDFYSNEYPELVNATWEEKAKGATIDIAFLVAVGKKG